MNFLRAARELFLSHRQVILDTVPDRIPVDPEIVMDENESHADNSGPGDIGMLYAELRQNLPDRFSGISSSHW
jgi:hypothetical protein